MSADRETLFARWLRLKQEAKEQPPAKPRADPKDPAPQMPRLDELTIDSDFGAFFHPGVDEALRRAALKKLFSDPRFNVMDGLDVYIDDYSKSEPIPEEMLKQLVQLRRILGQDEGQGPAAEGRAPSTAEPAQPAQGPTETPEHQVSTVEAVPSNPCAPRAVTTKPGGSEEA
ncbi:MAG: DUF3306 domain-containing protein [Betaproteobacteria bacterium]|nr:DUF3306 domain-containing protein [Betaproteobacteria bacterium]